MLWKIDNKIINLDKIISLEINNEESIYEEESNIVFRTNGGVIHSRVEDFNLPKWYIEFLLYVYSKSIIANDGGLIKRCVVDYRKTLSLESIKDLLSLKNILGNIYNKIKYLEETRIGDVDYISIALKYADEYSIIIFMLEIRKYFERKEDGDVKMYSFVLKDYVMNIERFKIDVEYTSMEEVLEALKGAYNKEYSKLWS